MRLLVLICALLSAAMGSIAAADITLYASHRSSTHGVGGEMVIYLKDQQALAGPVTDAGESAGRGVGQSGLLRLEGAHAGVFVIDHSAWRTEQVATIQSGTPNSYGPYRFDIVSLDETRRVAGQDQKKLTFTLQGSVDALSVLGAMLPSYLANLANVSVTVEGSAWVAKKIPEAGELSRFLEQLAALRISTTMRSLDDPALNALQGLVTPQLIATLTGLSAAVSRHGLPMAVDYTATLKADSSSPVAVVVQGLLDGAGVPAAFSADIKVNDVNRAPIGAERFFNGELPAGYTLDP